MAVYSLWDFLSEQPDKKENHDNHEQYVNQIAASPSTSSPPAKSADQPQNQQDDDNCLKHVNSP